MKRPRTCSRKKKKNNKHDSIRPLERLKLKAIIHGFWDF
ncbi:hypothetical protein KSS87_010150, partial [Heliosperma pusillum]